MSHPLIQVALTAAYTKAFAYQGVRKIINGMTWEIDWNVEVQRSVAWETEMYSVVDFAQLGYGGNKFKQLVRNYVNEEEFERVRSVLARRSGKSFTSVALSMRGASKGNRSMGHCMLSMVITRTKGTEVVEMQYRSTELTLKFGGDLCFLPWLFEKIDINPSRVTFRFANCYLSGVYLPYLVTFAKDPVSLLSKIWKADPEFCENATRFFLRSLNKKDQFFPYSPENVAHKFGWNRIHQPQIRRLREYLSEQHKYLGPMDWSHIHHRKGEYVPRGKRKLENDE